MIESREETIKYLYEHLLESMEELLLFDLPIDMSNEVERLAGAFYIGIYAERAAAKNRALPKDTGILQ